MKSLTTKAHYRERVKAAQQKLPETEKHQAHQRIYQQLFELPEFIKANTILAYASCQHEIDTQHFLATCLALKKRLLLPKINRQTITLHLCQITDLDQDLVCSEYANILEPKEETTAFPDDHPIDIIIIPAVAFDRKGQRLGRGMGYYDRFLEIHRESTVVGLAYEEQVFDQIPTEAHDQPIDILITPTQLLRFDHYC